MELISYGRFGNKLPHIVGNLIKLAELTNGRQTVDDILLEIINGSVQLWVADNVIFTTRIVDYPQKRMLSVQLCTGYAMESWLKPVLNALEDYAKKMNCAGIEGLGREGWRKILESENFIVSQIVLEKLF